MGLDTLAIMRTNLRFMLDNRADLTDPILDVWINYTYRQISNPRVARHRGLQTNFTIALVTGDIDYDIRAATVTFEVAGIHDVIYIDGTSAVDHTLTRRKLRAYQDVRTVAARPFASGPPFRYSLHGENGANQGLIIDAVPTAAENGNLLLVDCWRYPADLTGVGDLTDLKLEWDEVIVVGAAWRGWRDLNQPDRAEDMKQTFADLTRSVASSIDIDAEDHETQFEPRLWPYSPGGRG